jgi:Tir chaperone protein (CesT) family
MADTQATDRLNALLKDFAALVGADGIEADESGVCTLAVEERLLINFVINPRNDTLMVWSVVGELPEGGHAETLAQLMRANLFWSGTGGGTLGLMPDSDDVVLAERHPLDELNAEGLRDITERMIEFGERFMAILIGTTSDDSEHAPLPAASSIPV